MYLNLSKHIFLVTIHTVAIPIPSHMNVFNCFRIKFYAVHSGKQSPTFHKKILISSSVLTSDIVECLSEVLVVRKHPTLRHVLLHINGHICHRQNFKSCKFLVVLKSIKLWDTHLKLLLSACSLLLEDHCRIGSFFRFRSFVPLTRAARRYKYLTVTQISLSSKSCMPLPVAVRSKV
jgi:hypothetical protein